MKFSLHKISYCCYSIANYYKHHLNCLLRNIFLMVLKEYSINTHKKKGPLLGKNRYFDQLTKVLCMSLERTQDYDRHHLRKQQCFPTIPRKRRLYFTRPGTQTTSANKFVHATQECEPSTQSFLNSPQ